MDISNTNSHFQEQYREEFVNPMRDCKMEKEKEKCTWLSDTEISWLKNVISQKDPIRIVEAIREMCIFKSWTLSDLQVALMIYNIGIYLSFSNLSEISGCKIVDLLEPTKIKEKTLLVLKCKRESFLNYLEKNKISETENNKQLNVTGIQVSLFKSGQSRLFQLISPFKCGIDCFTFDNQRCIIKKSTISNIGESIVENTNASKNENSNANTNSNYFCNLKNLENLENLKQSIPENLSIEFCFSKIFIHKAFLQNKL